MPWFSIRPRDPADARWPLPETPQVTLKADDAGHARKTFEEAYPSKPFGTPAAPTPETGPGTFGGDEAALVVEETGEPPAPKE